MREEHKDQSTDINEIDSMKHDASNKINRRQQNVFDGDYFSREYLLELENNKRKNSMNEFRYHSIREDLKRKEQELNVKPPRKKLFEDYVQPTYRDVYDLNKLDSLQNYDQFSEQKKLDTDEVEIEEEISNEKPSVSKSSRFIKRIQTKVLDLKESNHSNINEEVNDSKEESSQTHSWKVNVSDLKEKFKWPGIRNKTLEDLKNGHEETDGNFVEVETTYDQTNNDDDDAMIYSEINDSRKTIIGSDNNVEDLDQTIDLSQSVISEDTEKDLDKTIVLPQSDLAKAHNVDNQDVHQTIDLRNEFKENSSDDLEKTLVLQKDTLDSIDDNINTSEKEFVSNEDTYETRIIQSLSIADYEENNSHQDEDTDIDKTIIMDKRELNQLDSDKNVQDEVRKNVDNQYHNIDDRQESQEKESHLVESGLDYNETLIFESPIIRDTNFEETLTYDDLRVEQNVYENQYKASQNNEQSDAESESTFVKGAAWMSIGTVISRIIGALYVIPWATWFGNSWTKANTLFSAGYKPYGLFLAVATGGFPSAISKQIAYYTSQHKYKTADKLFKNSLLIMIATGLISGLILFLAAPILAENTSVVDKVGATNVIRSLAPALVILPMMSLLRGYFQGFSNMKPTAVSQIIEQVARVAYMLAATYAIMIMAKGEAVNAVVQSTFAAFIGAAVALLYLIIVYIKQYRQFKKFVDEDQDEVELDFKESMIILLKDSIPFIILGSGIIIAQNIDTYTFGHILKNTSYLLMSEIEILYGVLSLDVDKLIMIIVSLSIALSASSIPLLTASFGRNNLNGTRKLIEKILSVFFIVMIPSAIGMAAIADNLYWLFYPGGSDFGPNILVTAALSSVVLGLYSVLSITLQSMSFRRHAVKFLLVGLLVKLILQYPLVMLWNAHGAILTTAIGLAVTCILMAIKIHKEVHLDVESIRQNFMRILIPSLIMGMAVYFWNSVLNAFFGPVGRLATFGKISLVVLIAFFIYGTLMALQGMLSIILGNRFSNIQEKLRFRR